MNVIVIYDNIGHVGHTLFDSYLPDPTCVPNLIYIILIIYNYVLVHQILLVEVNQGKVIRQTLKKTKKKT